MDKVRGFLTSCFPEYSEKFIPFLFLLVLILAFGIFIPQLGIYQDDWVFLYNAYARGPQGLREFLNADGSPVSSILNVALFQSLGVRPLYWHVSALVVRWLTVVGFWLLLRKLWPQKPQLNFWAALIFAVHPFFILQPLALTYLHIWFSFGFLIFSFYWMILSIGQPARFWQFIFLAMLGGILSITTSEYFAGLELLRPVLIWLYLRNYDGKQRILHAVRNWLPYILILVVYSFWRFFIYEVPVAGRNDPIVIVTLLKNPLAGLQIIFANLLPDLVSIVVTAWYKLIDPANFNLTDRRDVLFLLLSALTSVGFILVLGRQTVDADDPESRSRLWYSEAFWLGMLIVILGIVPPYVAGMFINEKNPLWNSRFGLASMPGASLLLVVLLERISTDWKTKLVLISILVGFSIGYHARYTNDFQLAWKKEQNFFRQLVLRVPALKENTAVIAEGEILTYMGTYPTAFAINTIYAQPGQDSGSNVRYWFFGITSDFGDRMDGFMVGMPVDTGHGNVVFSGNTDASLIISFEPEQKECLHLIRPEDATSRYLSPLLKQSASLSVPGRIELNAPTTYPFFDAIGLNYREDWCTYYQRADLARQAGEWKKVIELWNTAHSQGLAPDSYFEYFPFLDAYIQLDRWENAADLSLDMRRAFPVSRFSLCDYWLSLPSSPQRDSAFERLNARLECLAK